MKKYSTETDAKCQTCGCSLVEIEIFDPKKSSGEGKVKLVCNWENCEASQKEFAGLSLWRYK